MSSICYHVMFMWQYLQSDTPINMFIFIFSWLFRYTTKWIRVNMSFWKQSIIPYKWLSFFHVVYLHSNLRFVMWQNKASSVKKPVFLRLLNRNIDQWVVRKCRSYFNQSSSLSSSSSQEPSESSLCIASN